ncbi:MAG: ATP-binding protein [Syntrophotaleaceae bacterium]
MNNHDEGTNRRRRMRELARQTIRTREPDPAELAGLSPQGLKELFHEFGVYQVELETQNEELRETRERLRDTGDRYQALYDFAPIGYLTLDGEGFIRQSNLAAARLFGMPRLELIGRPLQRLIESSGSARLAELLEKRIPGTVEAGAADRKTQLRFDLAVERQQANEGFWVTIIDITETRRAEEERNRSQRRFRILAEAAPLGIFEADHAGRFSFVNRQWEKITGLSAKNCLHFGWSSAIHLEDRRRVMLEWSDRIGEGPWAQEFRLNRGNGSEAWARMLSAPSGMEGERPTGYVGTLEDITALRQAEEEMLRSKREAESANRAKSEFLANMSHEIRTPMTVFMAAVDHLLEIDGDAERRNLLVMAEQSAQRLQGLIDDLLDFSRIEAGKVEIERKTFDLRSCVASAVDLFALAASKKNLRLTVDVDPDTPAMVVGDPNRLGQVLINLIGNAVKFTDEGEIAVTVRPRGPVQEFQVADTGIGIPEEKRHLMFQSFTQADSSFARRYGGSGLGLAISKGLVELMGGEISFRSRKTKGTIFTFTLPMQTTEESSTTPESSEKDQKSRSPKARILLADDDAMIREMLQLLLEQKGWQVDIAETGKAALEKWQSGLFELIFMDLQMPEMNGLEATRIIREQESEKSRRTCVIGLTAHARREIREECLRAGMDGVLTKPVRMGELFKAIQTCLFE